MENREGQRTALVCLLPGLGDAMTASTLLRRLRGSYSVDVLTMLGPVSEYAGALDEVREVVFAPLLTDQMRSLGPVLALRRRRYDLCVLPFPATRWQYAVVAWLVNAKRTVTHGYGGAFSRILSSSRVEPVELLGGHRLWENDRLADAIGLPPTNDFTYLAPAAWRLPRIDGLLGIHPGTMMYKGNEARRWPFASFVELVRRALEIPERRVRVFFGPNETEDRRQFVAQVQSPRLEVVAESLAEAAKKLSECEVFVGNDAGFSHLAAALEVKTLTLFGMTDPIRAVPVGPAVALRPSECPPCHDEGMRDFRCVRNIGYRCLNADLSVGAVADALTSLFARTVPSAELRERGAFQLYGNRR